MKIQIRVDNEYIIFLEYKKDIVKTNLNNTNVINTKNLIFTDKYIRENIDLVTTFLNLIILKFGVNKSKIKDVSVAKEIIPIINNLSSIKQLLFIQDCSLDYDICMMLQKNSNLELIECYSLPEIMFYNFKEDIIKTRYEFLYKSSFFKYNNINTISNIYNKKSILVSELLTSKDIDDLRYFFKSNRTLKRIDFNPYNHTNLGTILKLLYLKEKKRVSIVIYENEKTTDQILRDIKYFKGLEKKFNVSIRIKYSYEN